MNVSSAQGKASQCAAYIVITLHVVLPNVYKSCLLSVYTFGGAIPLATLFYNEKHPQK